MLEVHQRTLRFDQIRCNGCMSCSRACPTKAIRVHHGQAVMLEDRCIDCGECFKVCAKGAVVPLTDTIADISKFDYKIAVISPTLFTQFDQPASPGVVLEALKLCGFDDAVTICSASEEISLATELYVMERGDGSPLISTFCPAVVRLIQTRYPDLVDQLLPLLSPSQLTAKRAKERKVQETGLPPEKIGAIYIAPCSAKMVPMSGQGGVHLSHIDSAVSIRDIFHLLPDAVSTVISGRFAPTQGVTSSGMSWALLWSLPRSVPAEYSMSVAGLNNVIRILDNIEKARLRDYAFIECHACPEGCVSGALTVENPYVARARAIRLIQSLRRAPQPDRKKVERCYKEGEYLWKGKLGAMPLKPLDHDISKAITKMKERERIASHLPGIDCGACGAPTCSAFAEDVVLGQAEECACVFVRERQVSEMVDRLSGIVHARGGGEKRERGVG